MAWGTPTSLGTPVTQSTSGHSLSMTGVTVSAGVLVVVAGAMRANAGGDTIVASDSVNGTTGWTVVQHNRSGSTAIGFIAWSLMPSGLSSGSITIADGSGAANFSHCAFGAYSVSGSASSSVNDSAATNGNDQAATTTPSITSGTPANAGDMFFAVYMSPNGNGGAYTEDATWNGLFSKLGDSSLTCSAAYVVNAGSGTKTHAPATGSVVAIQEITAFIVASSGTNVNLTGTSASGAANAVTPQIGVPPVGVAATGAATAVTPSINVPLSGVSAAGAANAVSVSGTANVTLTGISATGAANAVSVALSANVSLAGTSASGAAGTFGFTITTNVPLVGATATGAVKPIQFLGPENDLPVFTLMRDTAVATNGAMGVSV